MPKNDIVKFRVSRDQLERIRSNAELRGYRTVSSYLRHLALHQNLERELWLEKLLLDIHREVKRNGP